MADLDTPPSLMDFITRPGPRCENKKSTLRILGSIKRTKPTRKTPKIVTRIRGKERGSIASRSKSKSQEAFRFFASASRLLQEKETKETEETPRRLVLCFVVQADATVGKWYVSIFSILVRLKLKLRMV